MSAEGNQDTRRLLTSSFCCALVCVAIALLWQGMVAQFVYGGNWTAFFRTASAAPLPDSIPKSGLYRFSENPGYDGQFYHLIAHDPLMSRGIARYVDAPRLRYSRILLPWLAWLMAGGDDNRIATAYFAAVLLFVIAGSYWLSRYAVLIGRSPWWGALFLAVPGVFVSLDRMTTDIALVALTIGFAVYLRRGPDWKLYAVLVCAALVKELGFLLVAAYCLYELSKRDYRRVVVFSTSALPALAWCVFVRLHTPQYGLQWLKWPLQGATEAMLHPRRYLAHTALVVPLDYLALLGMLAAIGLAFARWRKDALSCGAALLGVLAIVVSGDVWIEADAFGRVFSPLFVLLVLSRPTAATMIPMLAVAPRAAVLPVSETLTALRAALGV